MGQVIFGVVPIRLFEAGIDLGVDGIQLVAGGIAVQGEIEQTLGQQLIVAFFDRNVRNDAHLNVWIHTCGM
ncbi:hypothetical protein [Lysobacter niastensis]|uniref:Uncharacterized protein n=1 Tax=Lysobacter niastensis TaxID=380629 RepID=A0ABS0BAE9_9GAMM|nr:hypothetical protein [Lysobacter niastensis]MBF6024666.1 hypothetical protein [Lysobacter niastensis]